MEKYITDERTGVKYELVGDYYFIAGDAEPEQWLKEAFTCQSTVR